MRRLHTILSGRALRVMLWMAAGLTLAAAGGCERGKGSRPDEEGGNAKRSDLELIYQTAMLELSLAEGVRPYLVIDVPGSRLEVMLKGALLLNVPLKLVESAPGDLGKFVSSFGARGTLLRPLAGKYLFEAVDQTPDSVLAIVSEVVNVSADLLQREIPERFRLFWSDRLILDVVSERDTLAAPKTKPKETLQESIQGKLEDIKVEARYVLRKPFGVRLIVVEAKPEDALTIFRICEPGLPTLLKLVGTDPLPPAAVKGKRK